MQADRAEDRQVLEITGADRLTFLKGLVTNDVVAGGIAYSALLTAQGKYLADFFLVDRGDAVWLDVKADLAAGLAQRLSMYKLRADVSITSTDLSVLRGLGEVPEGGYPDPRDGSLGWRYYGALDAAPLHADWDALRVAACIPEAGVELIPNDSYILEMGFERLNGVDFAKGCYVGQEVTARMKHKTELKKGLVQVAVEGGVPVGTPIEANGKEAGALYTQAAGQGLAYLNFGRAKDPLTAAGASVQRTSGETDV